MIWPFTKTDTSLERAVSALSPFIVAALDGLDARNLREQMRTRALAECYVYGAMRYLASYDNMCPASFGSLRERVFSRYFAVEGGHECFAGVKDGKQEQLFMVEGASALRRWLVDGDHTAAGGLEKLLVKNIT